MLIFQVYTMSKVLIFPFPPKNCQIVQQQNTMTSITDPSSSVRFTSAMEKSHNNLLKEYGEILDTSTELCQSHRQFVKSALGMFYFHILYLPELFYYGIVSFLLNHSNSQY